jgi:foldase protein PrsA
MKAKRKFNTGGDGAVKPFLRRSHAVYCFRNINKLLAGNGVLAVALGALLLASCKSGTKDASFEVAAKVGSREITLRQVDSLIKQQLDASNGSATFTAAELVAARLNMLDNVIQEEALFQKAQKDNLVPEDTKVTQEVQQRKLNAQLTEEQYQNQIKQAGLTEDEVKEKVRRELAINALRERERARVAAPTDAEIEKYYGDHKADFVAERGADISVIAVSPNNNGGEANAEQKIRAFSAQLKTGSDFATVALKSEEQSSAMRGGRLGFATEAGLKQSFPGVPDIASKLMSMTEGQVTEPMKDTTGNWYIFKLNLKREQAKDLTLADVRTDIINTITQQRQQVLLNAMVMVTLTEASIKNYLAERIVESPQTIVEMRPSQLLQSPGQPQSQQPQPRFENQNQSSLSSNSNRSPSTSRPASASANANR